MKTILGIWSQNGNTIIGTVDATGKASAVEGSETDQNYTHQAQVTIPASPGKAGLIVNHTYDAGWNEYYLAMYLDAANNVATLEAVVRNEEGAETSRNVLASRTFPVTIGQTYNLAVESEILSDGSFAVYGQVNDFTVVEAEDLLPLVGVGQRGFEIIAGSTATFLYEPIALFTPAFASFNDVISRLGAQGPDSNGNYTVYGLNLSFSSIQTQINHANKYVYNLAPSIIYPSNDSRVPFAELGATDLACMGILVASVGGALVGAYDYSIGDMSMQRAGPYAAAIKMAIEGFRESAKSNLINVTLPSASASAAIGSRIQNIYAYNRYPSWPDGY